MKIKDLPSVIKKRAKIYIKENYPDKNKRPNKLINCFDWLDTIEGSKYWKMVDEGRFLDAENHLREKFGDDLKEELFELEKQRNKKRDRMIELIEDAHWNMEASNDKEFKGSPFFLDEVLDIKVNEPEVVSYSDEMLLKEDCLNKIDTGWKPFIHKETASLGTNSVRIINDSFKKAIEMKKDRIVESVVEKFRSRSEVGIRKYGTTLDRNDLSLEQWLDHAIEEQMDSILYLTKIKEELKDK